MKAYGHSGKLKFVAGVLRPVVEGTPVFNYLLTFTVGGFVEFHFNQALEGLCGLIVCSY